MHEKSHHTAEQQMC